MTQVRQLTSEIINTGFYRIESSYWGLFCDDLGEQDGNPEFIFTVNYVGPLNPAFAAYNEKRNYHWPFPQSEIDKSNGILLQNPDYM